MFAMPCTQALLHDSVEPTTLWSPTTRAELRIRVVHRLRPLVKHGGRVDDDTAARWLATRPEPADDSGVTEATLRSLGGEHEEGFRHDALANELCVGGLYLRLYLDAPTFSVPDPPVSVGRCDCCCVAAAMLLCGCVCGWLCVCVCVSVCLCVCVCVLRVVCCVLRVVCLCVCMYWKNCR